MHSSLMLNQDALDIPRRLLRVVGSGSIPAPLKAIPDLGREKSANRWSRITEDDGRHQLSDAAADLIFGPHSNTHKSPRYAGGGLAYMTGKQEILSEYSAWTVFAPVPRTGDEDIEAWPSVAKIVEAWSSLSDDWDGNDAAAPSEAQLASLKAFTERACHHGVREPRPYITSDTEFGFHWDGERKASVSFLLEDRFLAFCPRAKGPPIRISGPLDLSACSTTLLDALRDIT